MKLFSGVDIIEINRIEKVITRWRDKFIDRIFTKQEYNYCRGKTFPYQHIAARFSAKEAVIKALGNFDIKNIRLKDIEILNSKNGKPEVKLHNHIKNYCNKNNIDLELSLSHTKTFAVANAIALKTEDRKQNTEYRIQKE